jgi:hypothetical protein
MRCWGETSVDDGGIVGLFSKGKSAVRAGDEAVDGRLDAFPEGGPEPAPEGALVRNDLVQAALQSWASAKDARRFAGVLRQCATGALLLDGSGSELADPARGFQQGDTLGIGYRTDERCRGRNCSTCSVKRARCSLRSRSSVTTGAR